MRRLGKHSSAALIFLRAEELHRNHPLLPNGDPRPRPWVDAGAEMDGVAIVGESMLRRLHVVRYCVALSISCLFIAVT